ncbi:MAG: TldD/PmbA family protein [Bacteroidales bacterium]|jgi:PmbA protein|nr:TldD/PmbA family protein [Bacteroidales bacterium]MCI1785888.1 TldD/PmbA family protein [Bacteroidales bacterium]
MIKQTENMNITGITDENERRLAAECLDFAIREGADKARITLDKSLLNKFATLNGTLDRVSQCLDRTLTFCLFVNGRYGVSSTNRLDENELKDFISKAISEIKMLAPDPCRDLPSKERTEKNARTGKELGLFDEVFGTMTAGKRVKAALEASGYAHRKEEEKNRKDIPSILISEEGEYSDSVSDTYIIDSDGLECRHMETSFEYGVEITLQGPQGDKSGGFWWTASPWLKDFDASGCFEEALGRASAKLNPQFINGGKMNMVVGTEVASKMVTPILNALNGFSIQQENSFLKDSLDKKIFSERMNIEDMGRTAGTAGAKLFDSEGVATVNAPIIKNGMVKKYAVNTYIANKTGLKPTIESFTRIKVLPFAENGSRELTQKDIISLCSEGILVTGFNGGNYNPATGDFSYGIEGFGFKGGKITCPVSGMVITGNFITLWNNLIACGSDSRICSSDRIPTLAFSDVDFSS